MHQPSFFANRDKAQTLAAERIVIRALGEFQSRGKVLAERELPLDRLRGALRRAAEAFDVEEMTDEQVVTTLSALGARVRQIPSFTAKHPYRVIVQTDLAEHALQVYREPIAEVGQQNQ
jgi:hypothetical protein